MVGASLVLASCEPEGTSSGDAALMGDPYRSSGSMESALTDPRTCAGNYGWAAFIATAAEVSGSKSVASASDTRAGSMEINISGGVGFNGVDNDPPFRAALTTLRNGLSGRIEQDQVGRRWRAGGLDGDGCRTVDGMTQCWINAPGDLVGGKLVAANPSEGRDSNAEFDASGNRVRISGQVSVGHSGSAAPNNTEVKMRWDAPKGLHTARLDWRAQFDADANGDLANDPIVTLLRVRYPGSGPDLLAPGVRIVDKTDTALELAANVQKVLDYTCNNAVDEVCEGKAGSLKANFKTVNVQVSNPGSKPLPIASAFVKWANGMGNLTRVRLNNKTLWTGATAPNRTFIDAWVGGLGDRTLAPGATATLRFDFANAVGNNLSAVDVVVGFGDGCIVEP
jgi:hypothetical protein